MLLAAHPGALRPAPAALRTGRANGPKRALKRTAYKPVRAFLAAEGEEKHAEAAVTVHFTLIRQVPFGQELMVCGSAAQLGGWDLGKALKMTWSEGDRWRASVALPAGAALEWKFVQTGGNPQWESCLNRTLCVDIGAADLTCEWGAPMATMVGPLHEGAAEQLSEEGLSTDDDAPPPAFKPAAALAQFADAVKASFGAGSADAAAAPPAAGAVAAAPASLLAAAAEVLTADGKFDRKFDPLDVPAGAAAAALADKTAQQAEQPAAKPASPAPGKAVQLSPEAEAAVSSYIEAAGPTQTASSSAGAAPGALDSRAEADDEAEQAAASALLAPAKPAAKAAGPDIKAIGKVAGTVAMGMGAAAMLSAFAVDIADVAVLGAVAAGSMAALSTPSNSPTGKKGKKAGRRAGRRSSAGAASGEAELVEAESAAKEEGGKQMISQKASAPGVILAASVLSAIDAGKKILASSDEGDSSPGSSDSGSTGASQKGR